MKKNSKFISKEKAGYIGILILYPLMLLFTKLGTVCKLLGTKKHQLTASVLTASIVLTMMPMLSLNAFAAPTEYNLWVGGVKVTSENAASITGTGISGTISYAADTGTLTLNNATISEINSSVDLSYNTTVGGIYTQIPLKIKIIGTNSINAAGKSSNRTSCISTDACLEPVYISGNGTLNLTACAATEISSCLNIESNVTFDGCIVNMINTQTSGRFNPCVWDFKFNPGSLCKLTNGARLTLNCAAENPWNNTASSPLVNNVSIPEVSLLDIAEGCTFEIKGGEAPDLKLINSPIKKLTYSSNYDGSSADTRLTSENEEINFTTFSPAVHYFKISDGPHTHCVCGGNVNCGDHNTHSSDITYQAIPDSFTGGELASGNYYLTRDIILTKSITINNTATVNLCLSGHKIDANGRNFVAVKNNGALNISDCKADTENANQHWYLYDSTDEKFYLYDTKPTGFDDSAEQKGSFKGGVITGVQESDCGGIVNSGTLNFYSGTVSGNKAKNYGGGIETSCGTTSLYNSHIDGNSTINNGSGGGLSVSGDANVIMYGGSISNNYSANNGGGVSLSQASSDCNAFFTMNGGIIAGNNSKYSGGGIYSLTNTYTNSNVTLSLNGGSITGNKTFRTADYEGGGVYVYSDGGNNNSTGTGKTNFNLSGNITVTGNKSIDKTQNIYLVSTKCANVTGKLTGTIGVTSQEYDSNKIVIAIGSPSYTLTSDDAAKFVSDDTNFQTELDNNGKIVLKKNLGTLTTDNFNYTPPADLTYSGTYKTAAVTSKVDGVGTITVKYYRDGETTELSGAPKDAGKYIVKISVDTGTDYNAANFEMGSFTVTPKTLTVTPDSNQSKLFGTEEPVLTYSCSGAVSGETPAFTGTLSRVQGEEINLYSILINDLALKNSDNFKASNYSINFIANKTFEIKNNNSIGDEDNLPPTIIDGANGTYKPEKSGGLTFKSDASINDFLNVMVDNSIIDEDKYVKTEGSTIITLKDEYLATLSVGKHTLTIVSTTGSASTEFYIEAKESNKSAVDTNQDNTKSPKTGDTFNLTLLVAVLFISGGMTSVILISKKSTKLNSK